LCLFSSHRTPVSQVPHKSQGWSHAFSAPDTVQTVNGFPSHLSRRKVYSPVLMSSEPVFRCFNQRFACARLSNLHLTYLLRLLTETFTTTPFERSRFRQFEASSHKAAPMDLPSSLIQHRVSQHVLDTLTWTGHRLLPDFGLGKGTRSPILTSFTGFSIRHQRFACAHLYESHLPDLSPTFPQRSRPRLLTWYGGALVKGSTLRSQSALTFFIGFVMHRIGQRTTP
jgi:hypothetical protein